MKQSSIIEFLRAFVSDWLTTMSGAASVPLTICSYFLANEQAKIGLFSFAIFALIFASFRMWRSERLKFLDLQASFADMEKTSARIEIIFDEKDERFVKDEFYPFQEKTFKCRRWKIGIKNASSFKSAENVTVRVHESCFVNNTIAIAHQKRGYSAEREPIIYTCSSLDPQAIEFIELFGMDDPSKITGEVFQRAHDFVIEARARDCVTQLIRFRYTPTSPPVIEKIIT